MNEDYISVDGAADVSELVNALLAAGGTEVLEQTDRVATVRFGDKASFGFDFDPGDEWPFLIGVRSRLDIPDRQRLSRRVYDALATATPWRLQLSSDDSVEIIATRPALDE